ncbi:translocation protein TolB [Rubripirellula tenax]|uniref:Translocation protein TolB n=1 Tax=Rubripirellula tenax TaxID=2528015 RepID=A0A5C6F9L6_9BACT|nr:carboxypeptidase regulatory-like domain-containing protein [Rubripirellula tenax]TWU58443.1 translocation protein TolB [Rubripirellula tenax]
MKDANNGRYEYTNDIATDQHGTFEVSVDRGIKWISVSHADFVDRAFELPADSAFVEDIRIVLCKQFRISGVVTDFRGDPIENATVCAIADSDYGMSSEVRTNPSGAFDFGDYDRIPVTLVVTAESYSPNTIRIQTPDQGTDASVRLLPGRKLLLRVVDATDRPVSSARVRSLSWNQTSGETIDDGIKLESETDQDGICQFSGVPSGEVTLEVFHSNYQTATGSFRASPKPHQIKLVDRSDADAIDFDPDDFKHRIFHLFKPDGSVIRPLLKNVELSHQYGRQGTASISSDGTKIAFDAHRLGVGEDWSDSRVIVANIDGSDAKVVSDGVIPALSPDGSHVAFSRASQFGVPEGASGQSIWLMKVDGTEKQMIDDHYAWGVRWTSDGRTLVYRSGTDNEGNSAASNVLRTYDLATGEKRNAWEPDDSPFSSLRFRFNVSRRGRLAVVAGEPKDTRRPAIAVVDLDKGISSMRFLKMDHPAVSIPLGGVMDFTPDNRWILMAAKKNRVVQPIRISIQGAAIVAGFPHLPSDFAIRDPLMTPDGQHLIAVISPLSK